jgi:UPF0755 protein
MKKIFITLLICFTLLIFGIGGYFYKQYYQSNDKPETYFTIKPGEGFASINGRLKKQGLINDPRFFHYLATDKKAMGLFKAGTFLLSQDATQPEILDLLVNGQPILISVTIPEGKNIYEITSILTASGISSDSDFLTLMKDPEFAKTLGVPGQTLEGYLYPETYKFAPFTSSKEVLSSMVKLFRQKTQTLINQHPYLNEHEVVTLASVVEKETGAKFERPLIASVFLNRLKKRMRLQSDPTTIYGIYETYQGNLKRKHLLEETPYNTYKIPALPIGPIASPSLEAMKAIIEPAESEYLFFVSKNDGTHIFTKNYGDHQKAVIDFQKNPQARKGKSWRQLKN